MLVLEHPLPITSELLTDACAGSAIRHGFFTRAGGVSGGLYRGLNVGLGSEDDREHILENRNRVCRAFSAAPDQLATPHQIHSPDVWVVDRSFNGSRPKADAVVSATPGIVLGVLTADCGPILLADPDAGVIGAAHAGWSGALSGVVENTIDRMVEIGAERARITACLGPSISAANYEVGQEFVARFIAHDPLNEDFFSPSGKTGHSLFDLQTYTLNRLARAGISAQVTGHCTYAEEDNFFSYRRATHRNEPDYGRQISAISIVDGG